MAIDWVIFLIAMFLLMVGPAILLVAALRLLWPDVKLLLKEEWINRKGKS